MIYYHVLMRCNKNPASPYVIAGEDCLHETLEGAVREASHFYYDKDYDLISINQVDGETGEPKLVYNANQLEDRIPYLIASQEEQLDEKHEAATARWEQENG